MVADGDQIRPGSPDWYTVEDAAGNSCANGAAVGVTLTDRVDVTITAA